MPTPQQTQLGIRGEDLACRKLRRRGYAILARRYRTRHGEIDVVAKDGDVLVFVEVKARATPHFGGPLAAVARAKRRKLTLMALDYLARARISGVACRFDVVAVSMREGKPWVELVRDAFQTAVN